MLKTPNRPRAPSAATLRVLYQLAYISSGTAVGVGALCADERRRRTQIVQRVADNAKRIRQSPRYAHAAAAVAVREQEAEDRYGWSGNEAEFADYRQVEARRLRARRLENLEGARMAELPSVVEEEYGKLSEGRHEKSRKRSRIWRPDFVEEHGSREPVLERNSEKAHSLSLSTISNPEGFYRLSGISLASTEFSWDWVSYQRPTRYGLATEGNLQATSRKTQLFHATKDGKRYMNPGTTYEEATADFLTRRMWTGHDSINQDLPSESLARDVDVFFEKVNAATLPRMNIRHATTIADELLRLSLDLGSVKIARSLLLWKLAVGLFCAKDLTIVATSFASIAKNLTPEATMHFFSDLFATPAYIEAPALQKLKIEMRLCAESFKLDMDDNYNRMYKNLTRSIAVPPEATIADVDRLLEQECRRLMDSDHLPAAIKLWCLAMSKRSQKYGAKPAQQLEIDLFDASIQSRNYSLCARMLHSKKSRPLGNTHSQKDAFIKACFEDGGIGLLQNFFGIDKGRIAPKRHNDLSPQSYAYLSRCFADNRASFEMFQLYYNRVPSELRASVTKDGLNDAALALKADWNATRNLEHAQANYEEVLKRLQSSAQDEETARPLHVAMIEVELSANQTVEAMGALSRLNKSGSDGSVAALTALALAKQKEWVTFGRLFEALKKDNKLLDWTPPTKRAFNNALHLFSRSHTAQQLSDFIKMAIDELGFHPNKSTWKVLLSGLVSKKALPLLKYWADFSSSESNYRIDADLGATLTKRWYLDSRQSRSHVIVMWFCRTLARRAPSLRSKALLNVVREAIGFDLRTLRGTNAPWMEPIIRARQAMIDGPDGELMKPGYIWNHRLYHGESAKGAEDTLPLMQTAMTTAAEDGSPELSAESLITDNADVQDRLEDSAVLPAAGAVGDSLTTKATATPKEDLHGQSHSAPGQRNINLEDLRPSYDLVDPAAVDTSDTETLERQMILRFSLRQYESALELYHGSLSAVSLPASPLMLEVAVESSLRTDNNRQEAERIMTAARDAGMNVTCAMGPLLIDQICHSPIIDRASASDLRNKVIQYYRANEMNGLHVKHHVGTAAAHTLIQAGHAESGVNLLTTIMQSSWSAEKPLDIAAMSVWLSGYAILGHVQGMHWVVEEVLRQGMKIDQGFLRSLTRARRPTHRLDNGTMAYGRQPPKTLAYLRQWHSLCSRKRRAQMKESRRFGQKLVNLLVSAASGRPAKTQPRRRAAAQPRRRRLRRATSTVAKSAVAKSADTDPEAFDQSPKQAI